jgi:hypothetical protein
VERREGGKGSNKSSEHDQLYVYIIGECMDCDICGCTCVDGINP